MSLNPPTFRRAFVQVEAVTLLAVVLAAVVLLTLASAEHRRRSHLAGSTANLQKYAAGITAFASDNEDRIVSYSWRRGQEYVVDGFRFRAATTDIQAAANQAIAILRTRTGRTDFVPIVWFPHLAFNHLALIDYLDEPLPAEFVVSPADQNRIAWQRAVRDEPPSERGAAYFRLTNRPSGDGAAGSRHIYSSSYEFGPAFYAPDARVYSPHNRGTIAQGAFHTWYVSNTNDIPLGHRRLSEVAFPSHKAMVYETHPGDSGSGRTFFAFPQARPLVLHADGSASVRSMKHANPGFQPNSPQDPAPTQMTYRPDPAWEPPSPSGAEELVNGMIRWTRSGLRGRDFNGPEVPWKE